MKTTIQIEDSTRDRIKALGNKTETYDQLLNRILDEWHERG